MASHPTKYPGINRDENGTYEVRYYLADGRPTRKRGFKTIRDARSFQSEQRKAKEEGSMTDPRAGRITFGEYARSVWYPAKEREAESGDLEPRTLTKLRTYLGTDRKGNLRSDGSGNPDPRAGHYDFLNELPIAKIRYSDIERWRSVFLLNDGKRPRSPSTANSSMATLSAIFDRARRDLLIAKNPCLDVKRLKESRSDRREIRPATTTEIRLLADALPRRYRAVVLVAAFTGLRAGELWGLKIESVNFLKKRLSVVQAVKDDSGELILGPTKNKERRTIDIDDATAAILMEQIQTYPSDTGYIFTTSRGHIVRHGNFKEDYYCPTVDSLGDLLPQGFRFQDLRHSHASHLIRRGASIEQVSLRLGHSSTRTTEDWYIHLFEERDARLVEKLTDLTAETLADPRPNPRPTESPAAAFKKEKAL